MDRAFWKGRKVFLTGHTGFKGSWLSLWLSKLQANVAGYALAPANYPNLFQVAGLSNTLENICADINDADRLKAEMLRFEPEIVFHLAAQPLVRYSFANPIETFQTNIMGTANVLEAIRHTQSVRAGLIITTDKCYEDKNWIWGYRENDALGGYDPYSSSKASAEMVTASYRSSFFHKEDYYNHKVAIATARAGNVLGGGDWATDRLVPDLMRSIVAGEPLMLRNPDSIRPWQHVLEPLSGYLILAHKMVTQGSEYGESWNFGPKETETISVLELVTKLSHELGSFLHPQVEVSKQPHETHILRLDTSKAQSRLGWQPILPIDAAIEWISEWMRAYLRGDDMRAITDQQIERYQALARDNIK